MSLSHRKTQILKMVEEHGYVSIDDLVAHFQVTPQTIRRDLNQLANTNMIVRYHGGAGKELSTENTEYSTRVVQHSSAKQALAKRLVQDIPDGASLFINIGTTTEAVARELLRRRNLRVVTNNIHVASILSASEDCHIIIAGGEVRHRDGGIIGESTVDLINNFHMDFALIGISGIDHRGALLDFDYREVRVTQAIIKNSRQTFLCADSRKFGRNAMVRLGSLNDIDRMYTDTLPHPDYLSLVREHGVELIAAT